MRVLVVEDETALATQLTAAATTAGYVVDYAADGARADFMDFVNQNGKPYPYGPVSINGERT